MTGIRNSAELQWRLVCYDEIEAAEQEIAGGGVRMRVGSPLEVVEIPLVLQDIIMPGPGRYRFRLLGDGEEIGRRDVQVSLREVP